MSVDTSTHCLLVSVMWMKICVATGKVCQVTL
jgi:hypothetical protein